MGVGSAAMPTRAEARDDRRVEEQGNGVDQLLPGG